MNNYFNIFVAVNYDTSNLVGIFIDSIKKLTKNYIIVIVDNFSNEKCRSDTKKFAEENIFIFENENVGQSILSVVYAPALKISYFAEKNNRSFKVKDVNSSMDEINLYFNNIRHKLFYTLVPLTYRGTLMSFFQRIIL